VSERGRERDKEKAATERETGIKRKRERDKEKDLYWRSYRMMMSVEVCEGKQHEGQQQLQGFDAGD